MNAKSSRTLQAETVSATAAQELVTAAARKAEELGLSVVIAVLDASGVLKAFLRMDGAALGGIEASQTKAHTAVSFGIGSHQWYGLIKDDDALLHSVPHLDHFTMLGGGYPLTTDGKLVGSIGVSGGPSPDSDMECARAGLEQTGFVPN